MCRKGKFSLCPSPGTFIFSCPWTLEHLGLGHSDSDSGFTQIPSPLYKPWTASYTIGSPGSHGFGFGLNYTAFSHSPACPWHIVAYLSLSNYASQFP